MIYIGNDVRERMEMLGLSVADVADRTFLEEDAILAILNNETALEEMEEFDLSLICGVLHCREDFFSNSDAKEKDLLLASMNRGIDTVDSMNVKAKIQDFMDDFAFIEGVLSEVR